MPRDSAGNYNLVAGNPVQSGEVISSSWANNTMDDISLALTDSLDRNGRGGMLAPFRFADGTNLLPGASWVNETTTGFYRFDGGDLRIAVLTQDVMRWQTTGVQIWNNTDMVWEKVLTGGANGSVQDGTADGQTLRWEADDSQWQASSALVVDDAGNVGIGSPASAAFPLTVGAAGTNSATIVIRDDSVGAAAFAAIRMEDSAETLLGLVGMNNGADDRFTIRNNTAAGDIRFETGGNNERMRIDSAGKVGINETNPLTLLHISTGVSALSTGMILECAGGAESGTKLVTHFDKTNIILNR